MLQNNVLRDDICMQYNPPPSKNKKTNKQKTNLPKPSSISSSPRLNVGPDPGTLHGVKLTPNVPKSQHQNIAISILVVKYAHLIQLATLL